jgi:hypothetical protein
MNVAGDPLRSSLPGERVGGAGEVGIGVFSAIWAAICCARAGELGRSGASGSDKIRKRRRRRLRCEGEKKRKEEKRREDESSSAEEQKSRRAEEKRRANQSRKRWKEEKKMKSILAYRVISFSLAGFHA